MAKVGGAPWAFDSLPMCDVPTMIVGVDIFPKTKDKSKSIAALVGSMDRNCSNFANFSKVQGIEAADISKSVA